MADLCLTGNNVYNASIPSLIEANVPHSSKTEELQVNAPRLLNCSFILVTVPTQGVQPVRQFPVAGMYMKVQIILKGVSVTSVLQTHVRGHWEYGYCWDPYL